MLSGLSLNWQQEIHNLKLLKNQLLNFVLLKQAMKRTISWEEITDCVYLEIV